MTPYIPTYIWLLVYLTDWFKWLIMCVFCVYLLSQSAALVYYSTVLAENWWELIISHYLHTIRLRLHRTWLLHFPQYYKAKHHIQITYRILWCQFHSQHVFTRVQQISQNLEIFVFQLVLQLAWDSGPQQCEEAKKPRASHFWPFKCSPFMALLPTSWQFMHIL